MCEKNCANKKREAFDVQAQRITGTEAEQYKDIIKNNTSSCDADALAKKKGDWKKQHEEMIEAVKMAKRGTKD